jgi:hypothetical protein
VGGFTPRSSTLKIVFDEDTPLHGLEIKARPCTIGDWNQMLIEAENDTGLSGVKAAEKNDEFAQWFFGFVESWNLELVPGEPSPVNLETWHQLERGWGGLIIGAWQFAMMSVPQNSPKSSNSGSPSAEQSLDLEKLSESLPNWNGPS